ALADSVTTAKGQFVTRTFTVTVSDGQLTLRLDDLGGADPNAVICGLEVVSDGPAPPVIALSSSPASVPEDAGADLVYTFSRTGDLSAALTVSFTVGGAAAYGTDYAVTGAVSYSGTAGTVTFAAGAATAVVRVRPTADATAEPDEAVLLTLVEAAGYDVGSGASASGTITDDDPPAAPAGLTATAVSSSQIDLTWSAVAETDGYKVERSGDGGATWAQVGTTSATSYAATGLSAGTAYAFRVRAYNAAGEGPYSASASATTPDAPSFTPVRLDFGTSASPLAGGHARVTEATKYSSALGHGWLSGTVASRDRGTADPLTRDFNFSTDATFAVDLPNGTYNVTLTLGDATHAHDQQGVYLEGALADSVTTAKGQFVTRTFTVTVSDGQLTLRLDDLGGADPNAVICALEVEAAGTSAAAAASEIPVTTATLAAAPIGSSRQPRLNQATAIRHRQPKSRHSAWSCPAALADPAPAERPALRNLPATRWRPAAADAALENLFADGLAEALLVG
ncbi:MAG TPA: fibronectin type III domain-containing protein, partial [Planctomycetaceae bacterium]